VTKVNINTILIVAVAVLVTLQLNSFFKKSPPNEKLIRAEMKIEQLEEKRKSDWVKDSLLIDAQSKIIAVLQDKDTVIIRNINSSNDRVKKIPATVDNFDKSELHGAFSNF